MMLGDDFRYRHLVQRQPVKKVKRVRDTAYWDAPYNTPITPGMREAKKREIKRKKSGGGQKNQRIGQLVRPERDTRFDNPVGAASSGSKGSRKVSTKTGSHTMPKGARFHPGSKKYAAHKKKFQDLFDSAESIEDLTEAVKALGKDTDLSDEDHEALLQQAEGVITPKRDKGADGADKPGGPDAQPKAAKPAAGDSGASGTEPEPRKADQPTPKTVRPKEPAGEARERAKENRPDPVEEPEGETAKPKASHFGDGGIADADAEGLSAAIDADPDRFEVTTVDGGQVGDVSVIHDKKTGETWYRKTLNPTTTGDDGTPTDPADGDREALAFAIAESDSVPVASVKVEYTEDGTAQVFSRDIGQQQKGTENKSLAKRAKELLKKPGAKPLSEKEQAEIGAKIAQSDDPGQGMRLALFDFLIGNRMDRHIGNVKFLDHEDGSMGLGIFDHGVAFAVGNSGDGWTNEDPMAWFENYSAFCPSGMTNSKGEVGPPVGWNLASVIFHSSGERADLEADFDAAIAGFEKIDAAEVLGKAPNSLDDARRKEWEAWTNTIQERVELLKAAREEFLDQLEDQWRHPQ